MHPLINTPPVLVGVTGERENTDALRVGVAEARSFRCGVTLVHAVSPLLPPPPPGVLADESWSAVGAAIVAGTHQELEDLPGGTDVPVTTVVNHGDPGTVFADLSGAARLIVLQHRDLSRLHRIVSGSTVASVATRAQCPVLSVPAGSDLRAAPRVVSAGVDEDGGPAPVLETAFAEASARGASLRLLHGWRLPGAYDEVLAHDLGWLSRDEARITAATTELRSKYPEVEVQIEVRREWPADLLSEAARHSELLVVGRHSRSLPAPRLGSLARALIAHAASPVMVVPQ